MKKQINIYRAETKKPRKEFTGFLRMFEPIRNLAITVSTFILISTVTIFIIIVQAQEAARFRLDNWSQSFENWREAWDYVDNNANYVIDNDYIDVYRITNNSEYYNLNGTNHVTEEQVIGKIAQRANDLNEWSQGYSDVVLTDGISTTDELFYDDLNSYKIYDSANGNAVYTDFEAVESYLKTSNPEFIYKTDLKTNVDDIYDVYKQSETLTFEVIKGYNFNEYISTAGEYTNIINHLGWKESPNDFVDDIINSVYTVEHSLIKELPLNFYENNDAWELELFDTDFTEKFEIWKAGDDTLTEVDYLSDPQSQTDHETWLTDPKQLNREAWNCDNYDNVEFATCEFFQEDKFTEHLKNYLMNYYTSINVKSMDVVIPYLDGEPVLNYINELVTDETIMERLYLSDLIRNGVIINHTSYEWENIDYPGLDSSSGWEGTILYGDALSWFEDNINDEGWKNVYKADALTGGVFADIDGSSRSINRFENFNNTGEVMFYDLSESLVAFLSGTSNKTGISLRTVLGRYAFYRLDIDIENSNAHKSFEIIDVKNYWKSELNKNRP